VNQGFGYLDAQGNYVKLRDDEGMDVSTPRLLAADGSLIPAGQDGILAGPFQILNSANFNNLNL